MEKKKKRRERVGKKKRERKKGKRRQKHLRDGEKFPHCVRAKGESNGGDTEFSSNVFVANDNPPVSCARQMQRTIWLDVCARSRSVLISVLLCPRSGITRAGERVSRRSVVIPRSSEGLQRGLLAKLICNAVTRDRRIHSNAAFPLFNFPYHLWNFPRPIFLHHPLRFTFFHHRFSRNFYPGTSTALAKSLCVLDRGELRIFDIRRKI